jgi:hypothetical protein
MSSERRNSANDGLKKNVEILIIDSERLPALVLKKPVFNPRD